MMFDHVQNEKYDKYCFLAALEGVNLKDDNTTTQSPREYVDQLDVQQKKQELPLFRDPSYYAHLDDDEKQRLTQNMMRKHKKWVSDTGKK